VAVKTNVADYKSYLKNIQPHDKCVHVLVQYLKAWVGFVNTSCILHCRSDQSGNYHARGNGFVHKQKGMSPSPMCIKHL